MRAGPTRLPQRALLPRPRQRVLHQVVGAMGVARQHSRIAPQPRDRGEQLGMRQRRVGIGRRGRPGRVGRATARARGGRGAQDSATCQTLLKPSPVLSPGLVSLAQIYSGLPLYAHCLAPSSRVMIDSCRWPWRRRGQQRRPVGGAGPVAGALAAARRVPVERVERHPLGVGQRAVGGLGGRRRGHLWQAEMDATSSRAPSEMVLFIVFSRKM